MRISDWSSDVCSSDLTFVGEAPRQRAWTHVQRTGHLVESRNPAGFTRQDIAHRTGETGPGTALVEQVATRGLIATADQVIGLRQGSVEPRRVADQLVAIGVESRFCSERVDIAAGVRWRGVDRTRGVWGKSGSGRGELGGWRS